MSYPSWKIIINESTTFTEKDGVKVFNSNHSIERIAERHPELSLDDLKTIFKRGISAIIDKESSNQYLIFSKSYNIGFVVDFRKQKNSKDKKNHMFIITVLPKGKQQAKPGTIKLLVENHDESFLSLELSTYLSQFIPSDKLNESEDYSYDAIRIVDDFEVILCEGKIYNLNVDFVEVA